MHYERWHGICRHWHHDVVLIGVRIAICQEVPFAAFLLLRGEPVLYQTRVCRRKCLLFRRRVQIHYARASNPVWIRALVSRQLSHRVANKLARLLRGSLHQRVYVQRHTHVSFLP